LKKSAGHGILTGKPIPKQDDEVPIGSGDHLFRQIQTRLRGGAGNRDFFAHRTWRNHAAVSISGYLKATNTWCLKSGGSNCWSPSTARGLSEHAKVKEGEAAELEQRQSKWGLNMLATLPREPRGRTTSSEIANSQDRDRTHPDHHRQSKGRTYYCASRRSRAPQSTEIR
jgi:hypothetical protein